MTKWRVMTVDDSAAILVPFADRPGVRLIAGAGRGAAAGVWATSAGLAS